MRACPACGNGTGRPAGTENGFELMRCGRCGTIFTAALPAGEGEAQDYSTYYDRGLDVPAFVERRLESLVAGFDRCRDTNRWLDVGCGAGALLRTAAGGGWTAIGTEVAEAPAEALRADGFDVRLGELESLDLEPESFDVVSAVEVLEHVPDPAVLISAVAGLLRPGGCLYLTTPNGRGISARLLGTRWSVVAPPEHLQLFSAKGMRRLLGASGLEVAELHTHAVNPYELIAGLRRRNEGDGGPAIDRGATSYELNESLSERRGGRAAKAAANATLSALRLGDSLKVTARRPG
jgi:2-polyprenyl-3-methyl-5-hydroxy-6-metoxy-1,4-benzoquinol methylase